MTAERMKILNAIGFIRNASDNSGGKHDNVQLNKRLEELKEYRNEYGDCLVPQGYNDNPKLGRWVNHQRAQ